MTALAGLRVAVTRAAGQAEELAALLRAAGAEVVITPLLRIVPTGDSTQIRSVLDHLPEYDWIIFTSANGVDLFAQAALGEQPALASIRAAVACVGPVTAAAARKYGLEPSVIPDEFIGHAIADALAERADLTGQKILLPRAGRAREDLPQRLRRSGALVDELELYKSELNEEGADMLRAEIDGDRVDLLTFTSGSTVRYFSEAVGRPGRAKIAVIGPLTADAARRTGLTVDVEAVSHTTEGLVAAIKSHFGGDAK